MLNGKLNGLQSLEAVLYFLLTVANALRCMPPSIIGWPDGRYLPSGRLSFPNWHSPIVNQPCDVIGMLCNESKIEMNHFTMHHLTKHQSNHNYMISNIDFELKLSHMHRHFWIRRQWCWCAVHAQVFFLLENEGAATEQNIPFTDEIYVFFVSYSFAENSGYWCGSHSANFQFWNKIKYFQLVSSMELECNARMRYRNISQTNRSTTVSSSPCSWFSVFPFRLYTNAWLYVDIFSRNFQNEILQ